MPAIVCPRTLGELLKYEGPNLYSREAGTLAAGHNLTLGTVLGRKAEDRKLYPLDPAATDGTEVAVGVLAFDCDAMLMDRDDAVYIAREAIVARGALGWPQGITPAALAAAIAQLDARGILIRDSA